MLRRVVASIVVVGLAAPCQCSFFDLSALDRGGTEATDRDAIGGDARLDLDAAGESGDEALGLEAAGDDGSDDGVDLDAGADSGGDEPGPDAVTDGAWDVASPDVFTEAGIDLGLVALYTFDETSGTTSADTSGNGHAASLQGATFGPGLKNNAATMNGMGQYLTLPNAIVNGLTSFSISTWLNLNAAPTHCHIFDFGSGPTTYMFLTPHSGNRTLQFAITTSGPTGGQTINSLMLPTGSWQHVVVTLSGPIGTVYVNGVRVAQNTTMVLNPTSLGATTQNWLGRSQFTMDPYLNARIDQFRIYNRALSASEVQQLFQRQL
jgi:hypothetical protein